MDIPEAISYLQNRQQLLFGRHHAPEREALKLAIQALKEKQEREKGD